MRPVLLITFVLTAACGTTRTAVPEANLAHAEHLSKTISLEGEEVLTIWIYAEAPDYVPITDDDEGYTCVDDTARFAVVALLNAERTGSPKAEKMARAAILMVSKMQAEDGQFYNFIFPDLTINREGHTSFKDHGWWAGRALWALAAGHRYFQERDPQFAARLKEGVEKLLPWYDSYLERHGQFREVEGAKIPDWLIKGSSCMTSEVVLGLLELYQAQPDDKLAKKVGKLCDGIAEFQVRTEGVLLYGAHPSNVDQPYDWHHWGSRQTMALARAARILKDHPNREKWLESARLEADTFFTMLLSSHIPEAISGASAKFYPQIAYGTNTLVLGSLELFRATGEEKYKKMALKAFGWYLGDNPPRVKMYDERTGRCFDGVIDAEKVNRNSGAESTIEALLAVEELRR